MGDLRDQNRGAARTKSAPTPGLPGHLGGQVWGNVDLGLMRFLVRYFGIDSMVDIGCGDGVAAKLYAETFDIGVYGIDGDWGRLPQDDWRFVLHDYATGHCRLDAELQGLDLAYSIEFLEHVEERWQPYYMHTFSQARVAAVTAAPPGWEHRGHHHVNCRSQDYWIGVFTAHGFTFLADATEQARAASDMKTNAGEPQQQWFRGSGMVFSRHTS